MKIVDEIYPFGINTSIGPTGTIKRLFRNREYFKERGYLLSVFALQKGQNGSMTMSEITGRKSTIKDVIL